MNFKILKNSIFVIITFMIVACYNAFPCFAFWAQSEKGGIYWVNKNNTFPRGGWTVIDEDEDGIGYYYYFDDNGYILVDDITPDYKIVDNTGRRIDVYGKQETAIIEKETVFGEEGVDEKVYSEDIMAQIREQHDNDIVSGKGYTSSGTYLFGLRVDEEDAGPKPSDNLVTENNAEGTAKTILGLNVDLNKKKDKGHDTTIDRKMDKWIKSGKNYNKNVNGKTYLKSTWKGVMALKGSDSYIIFENPQNNFNRLKGRIATHNFSYTETTTICTLDIINNDTGEELLEIDGFNYNGGTTFDIIFPRKTKEIKFLLQVTGKYTSRVCYLRDCQYAFDKEAYEEELYEDETERMYGYTYGTQSDADYIDYEDEDEYDEEEDSSYYDRSIEGEDPGSRYRRLNNLTDDEYWLNFTYDEDDDTVTEAMKASISEARARYAANAEKRDKVSGPAYDKELINATEAPDPLGGKRMYKGIAEGSD